MSFWSLNDKTQLALLLAGVVGGATASTGCDCQVVDEVPSDARVDGADDDSMVADMVPPDARPDNLGPADPPPFDMRVDKPPVADPLPPDMRPDRPPIADPLPPDMRPDRPPIADPLPLDASAPPSTPAPGQPRARGARAPARLPLTRSFRAKVVAERSGAGIRLKATTLGADGSRLTHKWVCSGGTLDRHDGAEVTWTPPGDRGRHMVQLTARDGRGAIAVDVYLLDVD